MSCICRLLLCFSLGISTLGCVKIDAEEHEKLIDSLSSSTDSEDSGTDSSTITATDSSEDSAIGELEHYIYFDGDDDFISIENDSGLSSILDWTSSWSLSVFFSTSEPKGGLFRNGDNWISFDSEQNSENAYETSFSIANGGNDTENTIKTVFTTFSNPTNRRFTLVYDATIPRIQVYKDDLLIHNKDFDYEPYLSFFAENKGELGDVELAKKESSAESPYFQGGLDEMMVIERVLTNDEVSGLHHSSDWKELAFYDDILCWWPMGEDNHPSVKDKKELASGSLQNASSDSFVAYGTN